MDVKCSTKKIVQNCAFIEIRLEFSNSFKKIDQYMKYILKNWFIFFFEIGVSNDMEKNNNVDTCHGHTFFWNSVNWKKKKFINALMFVSLKC